MVQAGDRLNVDFFQQLEKSSLIPTVTVTEDYVIAKEQNHILYNVIIPSIIELPLEPAQGFNVYIRNATREDIYITAELFVNGNSSLVLKPFSCIHVIFSGTYIALEYGKLYDNNSIVTTSKNIKSVTLDDLDDLGYPKNLHVESNDFVLVYVPTVVLLPLTPHLNAYIKCMYKPSEGEKVPGVVSNYAPLPREAMNNHKVIVHCETGTIDGEKNLDMRYCDTLHVYCDGNDFYIM